MRYAQYLALGVLFLAAWGASCSLGSTTSTPGDDAGVGGCPSGPVALFTLHVTAANGNVPPDTTLRVRWSAGEEPPFVLSDPSTWGSVQDGANVECIVDRDAALPLELDELVCELWTVGVTDIEVSAKGYVTAEQTLTPAHNEECDGPVPSEVDVRLDSDPDAGT